MNAGSGNLTRSGLNSLLATLGADPVQAAEAYERIRARLIRLFTWRRCGQPERLADETLDRVARRLADGVTLHTGDPLRYVSGVAYRVFQETVRREMRARHAVRDAEREQHPPEVEDHIERERRLACLDGCLDDLGGDERMIILRFYRGERIAARKALAADLGVSRNALRIRAYRLRARLESCVRACLAGTGERNESRVNDTTR